MNDARDIFHFRGYHQQSSSTDVQLHIWWDQTSQKRFSREPHELLAEGSRHHFAIMFVDYIIILFKHLLSWLLLLVISETSPLDCGSLLKLQYKISWTNKIFQQKVYFFHLKLEVTKNRKKYIDINNNPQSLCVEENLSISATPVFWMVCSDGYKCFSGHDFPSGTAVCFPCQHDCHRWVSLRSLCSKKIFSLSYPELTSQKHSVLISFDSEMFQFWFSAVYYLKISQKRWKREFQRQKSALVFFMFSELALENVKSLKQRCSALIICGTSTLDSL